MEGGNEATNGSGVTQFAEGEPKSLYPTLCSPDGECVIPFAYAHSITAFHSLIRSSKTLPVSTAESVCLPRWE